jgi:adenylosuccinate lyase
MTSSDVLYTCFNVQLMHAADIRIADVDALLAALKRRAHAHKLTPTVGRSYGIHAEPTTFGPRLLQADKDVRAKLSDEEIEANYDLDHQRKHVDTIFKRVFGT